jgi:CheY-like chemotaxis protein
MDLSLPEIDGVVATKLIRQIEGAEEVPIFAMTAHWSVYHPKAQETGLNGILEKPLNHTKLLNLVNQCLA